MPIWSFYKEMHREGVVQAYPISKILQLSTLAWNENYEQRQG